MKLSQRFNTFQGESLEDFIKHYNQEQSKHNEIRTAIERQGIGSTNTVVTNFLSSSSGGGGGGSSSTTLYRAGQVSITTAGGFVSFSSPFPAGTIYVLFPLAISTADSTISFTPSITQASLTVSGFTVSDALYNATMYYLAIATN